MAIIVDAMNGAGAPGMVIEAAARLSLRRGLEMLLVGDESSITEHLSRLEHNPEHLMVRHAAIDGCTPREASVRVGAKLLASGEGSAFTSASSRSSLHVFDAELNRLPGVPAPALCALYPTLRRRGEREDPFTLILDVGASPSANAAELVGYAKMGRAYAARISRNSQMRVAVLASSFGEVIGPPEVVEAAELLAASLGSEFIGGVSGVAISRGDADVIVTSGFAGNVVIEILEGLQAFASDLANFAVESGFRKKLAVKTLSEDLSKLRFVTDWREYGGAPLLGYDKIVILTDPAVGARAFANSIKLAAKTVREDIVGALSEALR